MWFICKIYILPFLQELRIIYSEISFYFIPNPATLWDSWAEKEWLVQSHPNSDFHRAREILGHSIHFTFCPERLCDVLLAVLVPWPKNWFILLLLPQALKSSSITFQNGHRHCLKPPLQSSLLDLFLSDPPHYTFLPIVAASGADFITFCLKLKNQILKEHS